MIAAAGPVDVAQEEPAVDLARGERVGDGRRDCAVEHAIGAIGRAEELPRVPVAGGARRQRHARQGGGGGGAVVGDDGDDRFDAASAGVDRRVERRPHLVARGSPASCASASSSSSATSMSSSPCPTCTWRRHAPARRASDGAHSRSSSVARQAPARRRDHEAVEHEARHVRRDRRARRDAAPTACAGERAAGRRRGAPRPRGAVDERTRHDGDGTSGRAVGLQRRRTARAVERERQRRAAARRRGQVDSAIARACSGGCASDRARRNEGAKSTSTPPGSAGQRLHAPRRAARRRRAGSVPSWRRRARAAR